MAQFSFKPYTLQDAPKVVELWNLSVLGTKFPLQERLWRQQTLGDPDFEAGDVTLALNEEDDLAGVILTKTFRGKAVTSPSLLNKLENYRSHGFIAAVVVASGYQRQGLGKELVKLAEERLKKTGINEIWLGPSLRHFFPGPPADLPTLEPFFTKLGYRFDPDPGIQTDLQRSLVNFVPPPLPPAILERRFSFIQGKEGEQEAIIEFLRGTFPGRWQYETELFFQQSGSPEDVTLLKDKKGEIKGFLMNYHRESKVIGPSIFWNQLLEPNYGGIGPLGISKEVRSLGLGLGLVIAGVEYLKSRRVTDCVIDWTSLVEFYGQLGFQPWKSYRKAIKTLRVN